VTHPSQAGGHRANHRWPLILASGVVLVAVLLALAWFVWLPGFRPELRPGERYGIDVSHHQGEIDWQRVALDRVSFAYIKATEGGDLVDPLFSRNWAYEGDAGLDRGAYHFFTLCTSGAEQAQNFLRVVPDDHEMLPPAVDLELRGNCAARPNLSTVQQELGKFLSLVETGTGQQVVLYVGDDFENAYPVRSTSGRPLWVRRLILRPSVEGWAIWQVSAFAKVDGIDGRVDLDVMR
jgi:lysozyme